MIIILHAHWEGGTLVPVTVDQGEMRELATGAFLDAKRNGIFIGRTGTGKTHLCIGVASAVIRARAKGRFYNLVDLVNQLEQEKAAGRSGRLAEKLLRYDLIIIDDSATCRSVNKVASCYST